jgi:hypothetical protein
VVGAPHCEKTERRALGARSRSERAITRRGAGAY